MIVVTVEVDGVDGEPIAAKEAVAMALEHLGGVRVREVRVIGAQQRLSETWNKSTEGGSYYGKKTS